MSTDTIHRVTAPDGTAIAGRVVGQGPPLVLLHGATDSGETAWQSLLPHLVDHHTCFLPSTRGRGLSADSEEFSPEQSFEDMLAFIDSLGQPVPLFGWSDGGATALGAAALTDTVSRVIAYEPLVLEVIDESTIADVADTIDGMTAELEQGRPEEAARLLLHLVCNDEEVEVLVAQGVLDITAPNAHADLRLLENLDPDGPSLTDPALLTTITVPVLLLHGGRTKPEYERGNRHVARHARNVEQRVIPGGGHAAPELEADAVAAEILRFLQPAR